MEWYEILAAYIGAGVLVTYGLSRVMSNNKRHEERFVDDETRACLSELEQQLVTNVSAMEAFPSLCDSEKHDNLELALRALRRSDYKNREVIYRDEFEPVITIMREYGLIKKPFPLDEK